MSCDRTTALYRRLEAVDLRGLVLSPELLALIDLHCEGDREVPLSMLVDTIERLAALGRMHSGEAVA